MRSSGGGGSSEPGSNGLETRAKAAAPCLAQQYEALRRPTALKRRQLQQRAPPPQWGRLAQQRTAPRRLDTLGRRWRSRGVVGSHADRNGIGAYWSESALTALTCAGGAGNSSMFTDRNKAA